MDIAAMSIGLSQAKVQQQAAVSVMRLAMDSAKSQAGAVKELAAVSAKSVGQAAQPHLGRSIDIKI
jgi:hypothetical protein